MTKTKKELHEQGLRDYPGAAIDNADDGKVSAEMVKERTKQQNNNPRNEK